MLYVWEEREKKKQKNLIKAVGGRKQLELNFGSFLLRLWLNSIPGGPFFSSL